MFLVGMSYAHMAMISVLTSFFLSPGYIDPLGRNLGVGGEVGFDIRGFDKNAYRYFSYSYGNQYQGFRLTWDPGF